MYSVYIVRCSDDSLYTGFARDPDDRVAVHNAGRGAKYTASRRPVVMVYREACASRSEALKRECQIKRLSRVSKEALISGCPVDRAHGPSCPNRAIRRLHDPS